MTFSTPKISIYPAKLSNDLFYYCTNSVSSLHILSHHCTFCASLHVKASPAALHINLLILKVYFVTFCLLKDQKAQSTHSGTFHCPGMDLAGTRDIFPIPGLSLAIWDSWSPESRDILSDEQIKTVSAHASFLSN